MDNERESLVDPELIYGGFRGVSLEKPTPEETLRTGIGFLNVVLEEKFDLSDLEREDDSPKLRILREGLAGQLYDRGYLPHDISSLTGLSTEDVRELLRNNEDWIGEIIRKAESLKERIKNERPPMTVASKENAIFAVLTHHYELQPNDILGPRRFNNLVEARQIGFYLYRKYLSFSLKTVGEAFGGRDHSTVLHGVNMVNKKSVGDDDYEARLSLMESEVKELFDS